MKSYLNGMKRYFQFSGRSSRSQFWLFQLVMFILVIIAAMIDTKSGSQLPAQKVGVLTAIVGLAHIIPSWAVMVRRLHDSDHRGWWILLPIIPIIFLFSKGTAGPNRFGNSLANSDTHPIMAVANQDVSKVEQLEKLASLRASGAITDEEFQRMKSGLV